MLLNIVKCLAVLVVLTFLTTSCVSLDDEGVRVNNNIKKGNSEWQTFPTYNR